jgi:transcriptional regulator of acetoin/glycerol metabolism
VRELKNAIERAALLAGGGTVVPELFNLALDHAAVPRSLDEPSREAVEAALRGANGVVSRAAQDLGLSRQALYRRMQRYGLDAST